MKVFEFFLVLRRVVRRGPLALALLAAGTPRADTLVLALDGVPYRVVEEAREQGAFAGWPATRALVAPFPSMTNVSFTLMLRPYGIAAAEGYEVQHYDQRQNRVIGASPFHYGDRLFPWREAFDLTGRTFASKAAIYITPRRKMREELALVEQALQESPCELMLAHLGATDALQHLRGDDLTVPLLLDIDSWLGGLRERHLARTGRPLHVLLLSDHGNTPCKVRGTQGFRRLLRRAGLRPRPRLERPRDVVAATFGVASYGALFLDPSRAETAARAVVQHPAVDVAAWRAAPAEIGVVSRDGAARIRWRGEAPHRRFAYDVGAGDPLLLGDARAQLGAAGLLDDEGFADEDEWFRRTAFADYPDALRRLAQALTGDHVMNPATVLFSLAGGQAWGWRSAQWSSRLSGGKLEGTHGGLDRDSTLGFWLSDQPDPDDAQAITAEHALLRLRADWEAAAACREHRAAQRGETSGK